MRHTAIHATSACEKIFDEAMLVTASKIDFDARDVAAQAEQCSQFELDHLPFGVILLDREGTILFYSATEAELSGYAAIPIGQNLFKISDCLGGDGFRGRIIRAIEAGPVDLEFGWPGDFANPKRELRVRVQSSRKGGVWLFIERDKL
jgi:photoactive yellow protein